MGEQVIVLTELTKQYGKFTAVDHIRLSIRKGEIFGLLGPNGAGKSTTILMMLGLTEPTSGIVEICGINSTTHPIEVKRKIGYLPEDVGFYDDMTGLENLMYTARLNGIPDKEAKVKALELMKRVGLEDQLKKKTGKYSRGMRQRLGLADVLIKNPEIIILDEPTSGIDPAGVQEFIELIRWLSKEEGLTVLFSSHHLDQAQKVCDRVGLFSNGKILALIDMAEMKEKKQELEAKGQQTADFINIVVWGKQAENCQKYLQKGRNVAIQGRLQSGSYTAQDGTRRFVTEVWAERVQFIDWGDRAQKPAATQGFGSFDTGMDDGFDLPFQDASDEEIPF